MIPYGKQWLDQEDIDAVVAVLKSDYLTTGPTIARFEKVITEYVGASYGVAVTNSTSALHCALFGCGIGKGDEVIVTPMTFAASSNAILYVGATPVFVDIKPDTYNIDPKEIEKNITDKTKAIVAVDFAGHPAEYDAIMKIAKKYHLKVIEDAAHALGSEYKNKKIGSIADVTTFSFHPVKPITTGEGGMVVTNDPEIYKHMALFRTHGITRDLEELLHEKEGSWYYEQQVLGFNYRMTDIQAALGFSQFKKLDKFIERRRAIVAYYNRSFSNVEGLICPTEKENCKSGYHIYVIRIDEDKLKVGRKEIFKALEREGIGVNVHYIPVYKHPYYQEIGYKGYEIHCPITEKVYRTMITLPLFPRMTDKEVEEIVSSVKKVFHHYRNNKIQEEKSDVK